MDCVDNKTRLDDQDLQVRKVPKEDVGGVAAKEQMASLG